MRPTRFLRDLTLSALAAGALLAPSGAVEAQGVVPGVVGGVGGLVAGGVVSVGIWTARARGGDYLYSTRDAIGWSALPTLLGAGAGAWLGASDRERLGRAGVGALVGGAAGTGIGVLVGRSAWEPPEGAWAGGVIGAAAGLAVGAAVGALWPDDDPSRAGDPAARSVPIAFRIPLF